MSFIPFFFGLARYVPVPLVLLYPVLARFTTL